MTIAEARETSRWRPSGWTLGFLALLAVWAMWESFVITHRAATHGCGGNFSQYYAAGQIARQGNTARLYDQPYFMRLQAPLRDDPLPSIYPPSVALVMAPLAGLSYDRALAVWWAIHLACILATGAIFYRTAGLSRAARINMLMALAALMPLWIAVGIGQFAPLFVLLAAGGFALHKQDKRFLAGLVLSLLAFKPQLTVGLVLWMVLRRDGRTLLGLAAGFAVQALAVAAVLGPQVWLDYFRALPAISAITRRAHYSPMVESSFMGIASNLLWSAGLTAWEGAAMKLAYAASVGTAAVMLGRVIRSRRLIRSAQSAQSALPAAEGANYEYACGVIFMTIVPPYLIVYDQTLLAIPLVMLWSSPAWRWGLALLATMTVFGANLSLFTGFNLTGLVALAAMVALARRSAGRSTAAVPRDFLRLALTSCKIDLRFIRGIDSRAGK